MVDFTLSASEKRTRAVARYFVQQQLVRAKAVYSKLPTAAERFQSVKPTYAEAVKHGMIKAQIPAPIGGHSESLVEAAIMVEEFYAVDASASLTIFGTG